MARQRTGLSSLSTALGFTFRAPWRERTCATLSRFIGNRPRSCLGRACRGSDVRRLAKHHRSDRQRASRRRDVRDDGPLRSGERSHGDPEPATGPARCRRCLCCGRMAMMQGGQSGGMGGMMGQAARAGCKCLLSLRPPDHARRSRDAADPAPAMTTLSRRDFLAALAAAPAIGAASLPKLTVTKDPTCSCCARMDRARPGRRFPRRGRRDE